MTSTDRVNLEMDTAGTLPTAALTTWHASALATGGATLALPALTAYDGSGSRTWYLQTRGANSKLDLSHVTTFKGAGSAPLGYQIRVEAHGGSTIDLSQVTQINSGKTEFYAQDANTQIKLNSLASFTAALQGYNVLDTNAGGTIQLSAGTTAVSQNVSIEFFLSGGSVTGGTLQLASGSSLTTTYSASGTVAANLVNDSQVTTTFAADSVLTVTGTYSRTTGTLSGPGTLTVNGSLTWSGGTMSGTGTTNANGGLSMAGSATKTLDNRTLNDGGAGSWTGTGDLSMGHGAALNLLAGATLDVQNDQAVTNAVGGAATVSNAGLLTKSAGAGTRTEVAAGVAFSNNAGDTVLDADAGLAAAGTVNLLGGTLSGSGTVTGNVVNAGTINPGGVNNGGVLTINGNYTQTASGVLNTEIGDVSTGSNYDQLAISGTATLDGTLNVTLIGGFTPVSGDTYLILTFASAGGTFATANVDPSFLPPAYDPTDVSIQAV